MTGESIWLAGIFVYIAGKILIRGFDTDPEVELIARKAVTMSGTG